MILWIFASPTGPISVYMDNAVIADASDAFSKAFVFIQGDFIAAQGQIRCGGKTADIIQIFLTTSNSFLFTP